MTLLLLSLAFFVIIGGVVVAVCSPRDRMVAGALVVLGMLCVVVVTVVEVGNG